jgi:hypothetical protein
MKLSFFDNVDKPEGCYVMWIKPGTGRQVLCDLTHGGFFLKNKVDFIEIESGMVVTRD